MQKTVWYLHHYAGAPELGMSLRPYYLASELKKIGYQMSVIASSFHHLLNEKIEVKGAVTHQQIDYIDYFWLKTPHYKGNGYRRLLNSLSYCYRLYREHKKISEVTQKPDVIVVSSPHPLHYLVALSLKKKYQCPLIFEIRDLWPLSLMDLVNISKRHPFVKLLEWIEKKACRTADAVVSLLPNADEHLVKQGLKKEKFHCIPNGIAATIHSQRRAENLTEDLAKQISAQRAQGKLLLGYAGAHGVANALEQLIDALFILQAKGKTNIHVFMVGEGKEKQSLQQQTQVAGLNNITFHPRIAHAQLADFLAQMDVLFIGWKNKELYRYGISPNKLFEYMLAAKPILNASNANQDPVALSGCGIVVAPEVAHQLADGLLKFSQMPEQQREEMGRKGHAYVLAKHCYSQLAQQYATLFAEKMAFRD